MNKPEHLFSQLSPDEQNALSGFYKESMEVAFRESRNAAWELAKVLFAANSGAAAGMFVVVRSFTVSPIAIASFYLFCLGVCSVVAAYFAGAWLFNLGALQWEEDIQNVLQDRLAPSDVIRRQRTRVRGRLSKAAPLLGSISFACFVAGGVLAGIFLIQAPERVSGPINLPPQQSSGPTNLTPLRP